MDDTNSVYVGGLSYGSTEETLKRSFMQFGEVVSVKIVHDRDSGESRGFGFVTFSNPRAATVAIQDMDGRQIEGRTIRVNEVRKNHKMLGARDRDFRVRDLRDRNRRRESPPSRERIHHRTRSPPLQRSRSQTPMRGSPTNRGSSPNTSPRYQYRERKEGEREGGISPQSSEGGGRKDVNSSAKQISSRIATDNDDDELSRLREELDAAREIRRSLEEKVNSLKSVVEKSDVTIAALKSKSQKLEESLSSAQHLAAQRQHQLKRLQTSVFHFKLATERLSTTEKEMKTLATLTALEVENDHARTTTDSVHANGYTAGDELNHQSEENHNYTA
ncbi:uncharacterized protein [Physcomitrium patens]|uniref:RRM domain-containing protein n=1 Tax=Physcomitrium patens TaxID=3218 RepID=A0A2K1KMD9_PHYPA|nr:probable splicing factor, arginine/serine-rich 4 [Physcomitrium patens]XP_024374375.1 probable splicing factor, arginine/serine-rich 4 [Physcomitrium patens]XP_024374376.1 probable splicing factor, arginine/serine-rich 4 [Physcomitrium patens]XP_024374377.1 probable splicing factor, arginine/serine-rich 4 [Physcomitrium patens]XP_024374378.1 probable splicing factor, arginine/serine-rich 4 [Physcomitrium patens]PNR54936.1 hypothetical protein PHYPA_005829 [Physcomitrium patens]|eukprot:XP_024374374.1 probable splicing factor, arginine/serine-rich 4 [Physcomitrella patens]